MAAREEEKKVINLKARRLVRKYKALYNISIFKRLMLMFSRSKNTPGKKSRHKKVINIHP